MHEAVTHALEDLLPPDIVQSGVEVLDARSDVLELRLVGALNLIGLANDQIENQLDAAVGVAGGQPPGAARCRRGREADLVVAGLVRRESEAARGGAALVDDTVTVIKDLLKGN